MVDQVEVMRVRLNRPYVGRTGRVEVLAFPVHGVSHQSLVLYVVLDGPHAGEQRVLPRNHFALAFAPEPAEAELVVAAAKVAGVPEGTGF